jgi:hypothetical protein
LRYLQTLRPYLHANTTVVVKAHGGGFDDDEDADADASI